MSVDKMKNVYIIEEKMQAGCQDVFQKSLKVFEKNLLTYTPKKLIMVS